MASKTFCSLLGLLSLAMVVRAYDRPEPTKDFNDLDIDRSGHASHEEVDAHLDRQFQVRQRRQLRLATPDSLDYRRGSRGRAATCPCSQPV